MERRQIQVVCKRSENAVLGGLLNANKKQKRRNNEGERSQRAKTPVFPCNSQIKSLEELKMGGKFERQKFRETFLTKSCCFLTANTIRPVSDHGTLCFVKSSTSFMNI